MVEILTGVTDFGLDAQGFHWCWIGGLRISLVFDGLLKESLILGGILKDYIQF